jgi:hypothetical protein
MTSVTDEAWRHISDPAVRRIFEQGAANGTLKFLYAATPGTVTNYVFLWYDEHGDPHDGNLTRLQLIGEYGRRG